MTFYQFVLYSFGLDAIQTVLRYFWHHFILRHHTIRVIEKR